MSGEDYAVEFHADVGVLAIFAEAQERYIPGSAIAANNRSAVLEFRVTDWSRSRIPAAAGRSEGLGEAAHDAALGNSIYLLPRSGRETSSTSILGRLPK